MSPVVPSTVLSRLTRRLQGRLPGLSFIVAIAFVVAGVAVWGFDELAETVLRGNTQQLDVSMLQWMGQQRSRTLDIVALEISALANTATLAVFVFSAAIFLWHGRHRVSVYFLGLAVGTGAALNFALKSGFRRPRPDVITWNSDVLTASFPSGHALLATVTYGSLAYLVGRSVRGRLRLVVWVAAAVLVLLIGLSRIYIGVHFPSDVLAGWIAGLAWTTLLAALFSVTGVLARDWTEPTSS